MIKFGIDTGDFDEAMSNLTKAFQAVAPIVEDHNRNLQKSLNKLTHTMDGFCVAPVVPVGLIKAVQRAEEWEYEKRKRGNVDQEAFSIGKQHEDILNGATLENLKRTFERLGDYPKPVPKKGRPRLSDKEKLKRKLARQKMYKGNLDLFE